MRRALKIFLMSLWLLPHLATADTVLLMAEEDGCYWCATWTKQIGPIYPKTPEGQMAPLLRYDVTGPAPDGMHLDRPVHFTPTFILMQDGAEMGRIEGYPGEDFFWGLLSQLFQNANISLSPTG